MFLKQTSYKPKPRTNSQSSTSSQTSPTSENPGSQPTAADPLPTALSPSSPVWQDRRGMFQTGRESASGRKASLSGSSGGIDAPSAETKNAFAKPNTSDNPHATVASQSTSHALPSARMRDRNAIWAKGKEVHEPAGAERRKVS